MRIISAIPYFIYKKKTHKTMKKAIVTLFPSYPYKCWRRWIWCFHIAKKTGILRDRLSFKLYANNFWWLVICKFSHLWIWYCIIPVLLASLVSLEWNVWVNHTIVLSPYVWVRKSMSDHTFTMFSIHTVHICSVAASIGFTCETYGNRHLAVSDLFSYVAWATSHP